MHTIHDDHYVLTGAATKPSGGFCEACQSRVVPPCVLRFDFRWKTSGFAACTILTPTMIWTVSVALGPSAWISSIPRLVFALGAERLWWMALLQVSEVVKWYLEHRRTYRSCKTGTYWFISCNANGLVSPANGDACSSVLWNNEVHFRPERVSENVSIFVSFKCTRMYVSLCL